MATTAIIGHGRSPEGRRWREKINNCERVVRMWDWHWQVPQDYGNLYHFGLFEIGSGIIDSFVKMNCRKPRCGWIASFLWRLGTEIELPPNTEIVDQKRWTEIGRDRFGGMGTKGRLQFTRGTVAALWALETAGPGDQVVLVGFDNIYAGKALPIEEGFSPTYRSQPSTFHFNGYAENAVKYGNHDFSVERPVMEFVAKKHGVKLSFAQDIW